MQTEEILTGVYGELHELLGDHKEFKRETLSRLSALEKDVKDAPCAGSGQLAAAASGRSGVVSPIGELAFRPVAALPSIGGAS